MRITRTTQVSLPAIGVILLLLFYMYGRAYCDPVYGSEKGADSFFFVK